MMNFHEKLDKLMEEHEHAVNVHGGLERRILMFIDRYNHDDGTEHPDGPLDPDDPDDYAVALLTCAERGVEAFEAEAGLASNTFGEMRTLEQAAEERRRRG